MSLIAEERKEIILKLLDSSGKVKVNELVERFSVSSETVRRDLEGLALEKKLKKVYGGATKISASGIEPPYLNRFSKNSEQKELIGKIAAEFVEDNDVIAIDVGTTVLHMIPHICSKNNITVVTNSVPAINALIEKKNNDKFNGYILFIGGEINAKQMTVSGPISESMMKDLHVDKAFIAAGGITVSHGITNYDAREASLTKMLINNAKESMVLVDSTKVGVINLYKVADIFDTDVVICDNDVPEQWMEELRRKNVEWISKQKIYR